MSKLIFFDLDGTLWDYRERIPQSVYTGLGALKENGHKIFICTGRSECYVWKEKIAPFNFDGIISACGTVVKLDEEYIINNIVSMKTVNRFLDTCKRYGMNCILEGHDRVYLEKDSWHNDFYISYLINNMGDSVHSLKENVGRYKNVTKFSAETEHADWQTFRDELSDEFNIVKHNEPVIEAMPKGYSKLTGIEAIVRRLGADMSDTVAFGDSNNDLDMLMGSAISVVMGGAEESVKEHADIVTQKAEEDGIYNALKQLGLI